MAKAVKKKNRRLKKTIRKTLGTMFLISALLVAAIPVENLQADDGEQLEVTLTPADVKIPVVEEDATIYTTGDGTFQFAYVDEVAVVLGYQGGTLNDEQLTIPDTVDAYMNFSSNGGNGSGYVAVGKNGNFLYYREIRNRTDEFGNVITEDSGNRDEDGNPIMVPVQETVYLPCYYNDYDVWGSRGSNELYYQVSSIVSGNNTVEYLPTVTADTQRIQNAQVRYIGNQYLESGDTSNTWKVAGVITESSQGIFAQEGNIVNLTVGSNLYGIGNYAFSGCSGLSSIILGNGLDTIGNHAFENCVNMKSVEMGMNIRLNALGDHAFYNCRALQSFTMPVSVVKVGDSAFEGCNAMTSFDMTGGTENLNVLLSTLGKNVFRNCESLQSATFPRTMTQTLKISIFQGCSSLRYISASNAEMDFIEDAAQGYTFDQFRATVPAEFYFEGMDISAIHTRATDNHFAFRYSGEDRYEITIMSEGKSAVYRVNSSNELVYCNLEEGIRTVDLPGTIGPYQIQVISSGTFQNMCSLEKLSIPSSILSIEENAFKGCHNLTDVVFEEPVNVNSIGPNAFKTQDVSLHASSCTDQVLQEQPTLNFVGTISADSVPFTYAMDPSSNINAGAQQRTYITFYSGWPTNLEVQYNPTTDKNELINYPTFRELKYGNTYTTANYVYMTPEYEAAAKLAVDKYEGEGQDPITDDEQDILDAALDIVLPAGIEAIQDGLMVTKENNDIGSFPNLRKALTTYGLWEIQDNAFEDLTTLKEVCIFGDTTAIGDHAFAGCTNLDTVEISSSVNSLGSVPFIGCDALSYVSFQNGPYYICNNSIIYKLDENGNRDVIVEYLKGRTSGVILADEVAGISEIEEEAFRDTNVSSVDLENTTITDVPEYAFADTPALFSVSLPNSCRSVSAHAFENSAIKYMEIPDNVNYLDNDAFNGVDKSALSFYCVDGSNAYLYAEKNGINILNYELVATYTVSFWDWDEDAQTNVKVKEQTVNGGEDATPPEPRGRTGYVFRDWTFPYTGISENTTCIARYEAEDPNASRYRVTFMDEIDNTQLGEDMVDPGGTATPPNDPYHEGYVFVGWRPALTNIQADTVIWARFNERPEDTYVVRYFDESGENIIYTATVTSGQDAPPVTPPAIDGMTFTGWIPAITNITRDTDTYARYSSNSSDGGTGGSGDGSSSSGSGSSSSSGSGSGSSSGGSGSGTGTSTFYTLTVRNGSGSGSYAAGSQPIVIANDPASNQAFDSWTIDPADTAIASKVLTATVITMPSTSVTVTANYRARTNSTTSGGGTATGNTSSNRPNNTTGNVTSGGTTVVIDKNGLSNTGVVSATVNGSSDNFTIRVTESSTAAEAVVQALIAEYGSDLSAIKYFPMDISLYDSTGNTRITDTTGLSIDITLPLPDSLITYAGNNRVAGIVNNRLDRLNPRFTTINGVACVTFTAEHFSPYVIYVDTNNLSAGSSDSTPKTGDGIHPKWFLSMGLLCISMVLFLKRDRRTLQKLRVS